MLINKVNCPFGCANSTVTESVKNVNIGNSNILLDSSRSVAPVTQQVKVYTCHCCGNKFETHNRASGNGRMVL